MEVFELRGEYIKLGQLVKFLYDLPSGGAAKFFLEENEIFLNGELENRRGKKIVVGDVLKINGELIKIEPEE